MAQITRNKKLIAGFLAMSCACILGACDPMVSTPSNYMDPILTKVEDDENIMGNIYELVKGDKNAKVVEIILDEIAKGKFGTYSEIMTKDPDTFIKEHKDVFDNVKPNEVSAQERARFEYFKNEVNRRIQKSFYALITSTEYQDDDKKFDEEKLYDKLKEDWDLNELPDGAEWKKFYITNQIEEEKALDMLNKSLYSVKEGEKEIPGYGIKVQTRGYIEKKIFPQVIKDILVEEYIYQNNKTALGRAYARKVNYAKISYNSENADFVKFITKKFVNSTVYTAPVDASKPEIDFEVVNKAIQGFDRIGNNSDPALVVLNGDEANALNKSFYESMNGNVNQKEIVKVTLVEADPTTGEKKVNSNYFQNGLKIFDYPESPETLPYTIELYGDSELGKLVDKYEKAIKAEENKQLAGKEQKEALQYFEGGEEKTLFEKFRNKVIGLANKKVTNNGWYVKNGGLSELPMRDRLFSFNVADNLETGFVSETEGSYGNYRYKDGDKTKGEVKSTPYARKIQGRVFVMPEKPESFDDNPNNFVVDQGSALHICQVLEAPSSLKLDVGKKTAYKARGDKSSEIVIEEISREIASVLSTKESYVTNAYTDYLNAYEFKFNDTSLYDYFKGQYPELEMFEEE